ncbi:YjbH domain-containing protein [Candidatus Poribacteria bacterium]|nr:YjbH domain-containing protein [Candidatus Poribacteria bacterium]MYA57503.1 YjbH domain-containing protein [Candidatus Poribacteria bacterium]
MVKYQILFLLFLLAFITISHPASGEIFTESGLVDLPTGNVLKHGIFGAGTYMAFQHSSETLRAIGENNVFGNAIAIRLNFGLFDRVGVGLKYLWNEHDAASFIDWTATLKVQLLKEQEVGTIPSVAIGIETLSDRLFSGNSEAEENENPAAFLAISKTFNLPRIHQFSGHLGVGTQRFAFGESPIGLFVGLSKEFQPAFARGDITMNLEFDGAGVNAGMRYITPSGLQVALGAETLNTPDELRYLAAVSWTNERLVDQINETRGLIKRATELAIEAKRSVSRGSK